jgi:ABC-type branched-subunit amino acid transport system substrate-binding protein
MIRRRPTRALAVLTASVLVLAACGGDDSSSTTTAAPSETTEAPTDTTEAPTDTTEAPTDTTEAPTETTEAPAPEAWAVDTEACIDPDAANAPIEGTIKIGSAMPLSGGAAAIAFAPVADGFKAYFDYANENNLLEGITIEATVADDQYNPQLTPGVVNDLIDSGVHVFTGMIGTPNNAAVRDLLNDECIPQMLALTGSSAWGDAENYPWTTGALIPYFLEVRGYLEDIKENFPDGATLGLFHVANDFGAQYAEALAEEAADYGVTVVDTQTIEATDEGQPTAQVNSLARSAPDVIMTIPLGAQCGRFLNELENAKAANPGWDPRVYVTNTCASALILSLAGAAADGIITSATGGLVDVGNPEVAARPAVAEYIAYMESKGLGDIITTGGAGWTVAEMTVAILRQAAASPEGLTRASIINAARNIDYTPTLAREGVNWKMSGLDDTYYAEQVQIIQYDFDSQTFTDIGTLKDFSSS